VTEIGYAARAGIVDWIAWDCAEGHPHVRIGQEDYMVGADGLLMPAKKGQRPPDLRYFKETRK